jgi:hypothetical protein
MEQDRPIEVKLMNFDTIILSSGVFMVMLMATFFGINPENVLLYLVVGMSISVYKLLKAKQNSRRSVIATMLLGFVMSIIAAPSIELKFGLHPLEAGACLMGLVLAGELGIEVLFKRIVGIEIEVSKPPQRKRKIIETE